MHRNYRFRIQRVKMKAEPQYQLRVGLEDEKGLEYIPVHTTAFARRMPLQKAHTLEADAHLELSTLLEWLNSRWGHTGKLEDAA